MSKIRIAVIGAGVLGSYHTDKCLKNPEVDFAGIYDVSGERAAATAQRLGVRQLESMETLYAAADAVIVATPGSTHRDVVCACLSAGLHVLVEKPLACTYADGAYMAQMATDKKRILHVGHSEVYNSAFERLCAFDPAPRFIEVHRLASFSPRGTDVSVVLDLMIHDIELVLRLCREEPLYDRIAAAGTPVMSTDIDIANVRLVFPSGCVANLTASRISLKKMRKIRIFQQNAYLSADLGSGKVERYTLIKTPVAEGALPIDSFSEVMPPADALTKELACFVAAIAGKLNVGVNATEVLPVLKVSDAILAQIGDNSR